MSRLSTHLSIVYTYMLATVETNYEGNCQDSRHEAHVEKYLLTGHFKFFS